MAGPDNCPSLHNTGMVGIGAELIGSAPFHVPTNAWSMVTQSLVSILLSHRLLLPLPASLVAHWQSLQLQHQSEKLNSGPTNHK